MECSSVVVDLVCCSSDHTVSCGVEFRQCSHVDPFAATILVMSMLPCVQWVDQGQDSPHGRRSARVWRSVGRAVVDEMRSNWCCAMHDIKVPREGFYTWRTLRQDT